MTKSNGNFAGGRTLTSDRIVVIGAGVAGLVAALRLALEGFEVVLVERAETPGGKMRRIEIDGCPIDAGPTVFTMRWVFDEIFAAAGTSLDRELSLQPVDVLARHAWGPHERLDLFADETRSAEAIGEFAGAAEARRYRAFCQRARQVYETLEVPFIRAAEPSPVSLVRAAGLRGLGKLWQVSPFAQLWQTLGQYFHDTRLRQLFGRYATYCGASPFGAPATLMLIAHVEQNGVWLVQDGMYRIAQTLAGLATYHGARFRYGEEASEILVAGGRVSGVRLASGERIGADAVVVNADAAALARGRFGAAVSQAVPAVPRSKRSLSAVTWALLAETEGFPLIRHNVFFSGDYASEFDDIFQRGRLPVAPTVYVCAQDRGDAHDPDARGHERLLCLVNAPALGDIRDFDRSEIEQCEKSSFGLLERCGLHIKRRPAQSRVTTPAAFERLFPATGGALYGQALHGWKTSFNRPGARTPIAGLYLAGGSVHPGPGVPMAALSGQLAAACVTEDRASTARSRRAAMPGGTSMPSVMTGSKRSRSLHS